jgi:hypothetical protein
VTGAQSQAAQAMYDLGVQPGSAYFEEGEFRDSLGRTRHGYLIRFHMHGIPGNIVLAGLPMHHKSTPKKLKAIRVQALLVLRDWFKAGITSIVFTPSANPLFGFLEAGPAYPGKSLAEVITERWQMPQIGDRVGSDIVDGEIKEIK